MIRDYPQYGHDWEVMHGARINSDGVLPTGSGIAKHQLGIGLGYHNHAGSRLVTTICTSKVKLC